MSAVAALTGGAGAQLSSWTDVATPELRGVDHTGHRGAAWGDFDADGLIDLYVAHWGHSGNPLPGSSNQLFRNTGGAVLQEVTAPPVDAPGSLSHHPAWGDIDNDGLLDLYVGSSANFGTAHSNLWRQGPAGTFTDVTNGEPLAMSNTLPRAVSWVDHDLDGRLDLFVTTSGAITPNRLLRNRGDGTFEGVTGVFEQPGRRSRGAAWCDYNNDGRQDLYIGAGAESYSAVDQRTNSLYLNVGGGAWVEVGAAAGVDHPGHARGAMWGDYDNDGWFDLIVGNNIGTDISGHNVLYRNNGDGTFTDVTLAAGILEDKRTRDVAFVDYDNDGWLDIYVVNFGTLDPPNSLYRNDRDGTFTDVAPGTPVEAGPSVSGGAWADYDGDGWMDVFTVGGSGAFPGVGENRLCHNDNQDGSHWIELDLVGTVSNRLAVGARVTLTAGGVTQSREVQSGVGYNMQHMHRVHFGLGAAATADTIEIRWPSGLVQTLTDVAADRILAITEDPLAPFADCDMNLEPDVVEIVRGDHRDCNVNGVPDACDIAGDPSLDLNLNGVPRACEAAGDQNGDGLVDTSDLLGWLGAWGPCPDPCPPGCPEDGNGDCVVDVQDLLTILANWS
jgi:hypothetical protein